MQQRLGVFQRCSLRNVDQYLEFGFVVERQHFQHDETDDPRLLSRMRNLSGPGLVLYGLTITFASTDWIMSLEPDWFSTIYSFIFAALQFQLALAFAIVMLALLAGSKNQRSLPL